MWEEEKKSDVVTLTATIRDPPVSPPRNDHLLPDLVSACRILSCRYMLKFIVIKKKDLAAEIPEKSK